MLQKGLDKIHHPFARPDAAWETFHENSKIGHHDEFPSPEFVRTRMAELAEAMHFDNAPARPLPTELSGLAAPLGDAIARRASARQMRPGPVPWPALAAMLRAAYGVTHDERAAGFPRRFRSVPSGGALYPLDLFFHTVHVPELEPGLYHFNPLDETVRLLRRGDSSRGISQGLVQPGLALDCSVMVFMVASFERSVFKYGDRGYRFVLIEAGHVAQNLNLAAAALGFGTLNIGGFFDRVVDGVVGADGLNHSTLYLTAIGHHEDGQGEGAESF